MSGATGSPAPACALFDLDDHRVLDAACPSRGVLSARVHQRTHQHLRDVPVAGGVGDLGVVLVRRRSACTEAACLRRTSTDVSDQVPRRARVTT